MISLVSSFVVFDVLKSSFELVFLLRFILEKKGNEVLTRVIFFGPGKYIQNDLLFTSHIVRDRVLFVLITDREWPLFVRMQHDLLSLHTD